MLAALHAKVPGQFGFFSCALASAAAPAPTCALAYLKKQLLLVLQESQRRWRVTRATLAERPARASSFRELDSEGMVLFFLPRGHEDSQHFIYMGKDKGLPTARRI